MAIVEDGVVLAIGLLDLVQALRDEEGADAIACQEGEARLEEVEASKRRELVEHHQQALSVIRVTSSISVCSHRVQAFGQSSAYLVGKTRKSVGEGKRGSVRVD